MLLLCFAGGTPWQKLSWWLQHSNAARVLAVLVLGAGLAQVFVIGCLEMARRCFPVEPRDGSPFPQLAIGLAENVAYPVLFAAMPTEPGDALTAIGAWIGLKTLGGWKAWQEHDDGRRRLYGFMLANAVQVAAGAIVAYSLVRWALPR